MPEKLEDELDQLSDEEIEKRLAAAVWVDDKRAAVLRYLEEKKLGRKKEAQAGELEIVRSARDAAWAAVEAAKEANWRANIAIAIAPWRQPQLSQQRRLRWSLCMSNREAVLLLSAVGEASASASRYPGAWNLRSPRDVRR